MTRRTIITLTSLAAVLVIAGCLAFLVIPKHTASGTAPGAPAKPTVVESSHAGTAPGTPAEPTDIESDEYAARGGDGPYLIFSEWDTPIGKGGTVNGVLGTDDQMIAIKAIEKDYRQRHPDAEPKLYGTITGAHFDAHNNILYFKPRIHNDVYAVRYEVDIREVRITTPDHKHLVPRQ